MSTLQSLITKEFVHWMIKLGDDKLAIKKIWNNLTLCPSTVVPFTKPLFNRFKYELQGFYYHSFLPIASQTSTTQLKFKANKELFNEVDRFLLEQFPQNEPGGVVLISRDDIVLFKKPYGLSNIESSEAIHGYLKLLLHPIKYQPHSHWVTTIVNSSSVRSFKTSVIL